MGQRAWATGLLLLSVLAACTGSVSPLPDADDLGADDDAAETLTDDGADVGGDPAGDSLVPGDNAPDLDPPTIGPLVGLPSAEGAHIADIRDLGDDAWLELPSPTADPTYGTAPGRSWGGRAFAWAPDLSGAFLYGEGPHGFVYRDTLANDELWFYDVNANRWITVHPGTDTATFSARVAAGELALDDNLQLADATGQQIPVHVLIHAWGFLAYESEARAFTFFADRGLGTYYLPGWDNGAGPMAAGIAALEDQVEGRSEPVMGPWTYSVETGRFARGTASGVAPPSGNSAFPQLHAVTSMHELVLAGSSGVFAFDTMTRTWRTVDDGGTRPTGYDQGACYDPTRERIYMGGGSSESVSGLYTFDLVNEEWLAPASGGPSGFGTNSATVSYDSANDVVTIIHRGDRTIYVFDPATSQWSDSPFAAEVEFSDYASMMGFYDPRLNAYFLYFAVDGVPDGSMWVYRYRSSD
ncbi:MAG: hypothetical protein ACAI38_15455 [Myxococcota bacterium]